MPVFRKTTKQGVRKHRNYTNKRRSRHQKYTGGRLDQKKKTGFRDKRNTNKLFRTKSFNDILNPLDEDVWGTFNKNIINDGFEKKVNKFKEKIGNVDGKIVYGKFWMTNCGHCTAVKGTWDLVVKSVNPHPDYVNVDIVSDNIEEGKTALKEKTGLREDIISDGYPCFYKIIKGHIYYYQGERSVNSMKMWVLSDNFSI